MVMARTHSSLKQPLAPDTQFARFKALAMVFFALNPALTSNSRWHVSPTGDRDALMNKAKAHEDVNPKAARSSPNKPTREIAHRTLLRCFRDGAFASQILDAEFTKADTPEEDRATATSMVFGCLRYVKSLDWSLSKAVAGKIKCPLAVRVALRMGAYDLLYRDTPDYAAVNEAVSLIADSRLRKFANFALRNLARNRTELEVFLHDSPTNSLTDLETKTSVPYWILEDLHSNALTSMNELTDWASATHRIPTLTLRVRPTSEVDVIAGRLQEVGVNVSLVKSITGALDADFGVGKISSLPGFAEGHWSVQDVGAQLVGFLADPPPCGTVLDLCSAPGGKTTHLAELMDDQGKILSIEVHKGKAKLVENACERLGLKSVQVHVADARDTKAVHEIIGSSGVDAVVLDAPCSGSGTLRRNPEHRLVDGEGAAKLLKELTSLQDQLLDAAATYVRPGGTLTYSVCSVMSAETDSRIQDFLQRHSGTFTLVKPITDSRLEAFVSNSPVLGERSCLRSWTHQHSSDSHFAAKLMRIHSA